MIPQTLQQRFEMLNDAFNDAIEQINELEKQNEELIECLRKAKQFIIDGVEFDYIRLPDKNNLDSALLILPLINKLLKKHTGKPIEEILG